MRKMYSYQKACNYSADVFLMRVCLMKVLLFFLRVHCCNMASFNKLPPL